jgi:isoquinoline 1-oxidoreductase
MRNHLPPPEASEPERYELLEGPAYTFAPTRREFAGLAAGLLISVAAPAQAQRGASTGGTLGARLHLGEDGIVTVFTGKVEVGQGSRTELAMAAAEELRVPLDKIRMVMADTGLVPNDGITAGSRSTPGTVPLIRRAAAVARQLSEARKQSYAELAKSPAIAAEYAKQVTEGVTLTAVKDWRLLGTSQHHTTAREIATGALRYPSDIVRPGMLHGVVLRPPTIGATLASVDPAAASKLAGVTAVRDGAFAGCAAPTSFAARKALAAMAATARWEPKDHPSSVGLFERLKQSAVTGEVDARRRPRADTRGSLEAGLAAATRKHNAAYQTAFIQHAPMEPRAAVAEWTDGKLTVWTGTQNPHGVRDQLAQAFRLAPDKVRVIVPDTGGGFGGKHTPDAAIEAARLAREAGRPVSVRWTRAEEFLWAYSRPAGLFELSAGLDAAGKLVAWDHTTYNAGASAIDCPYACPNLRTRFLQCDSPLREGSYRGLAATTNNFAREVFIDELAALAGQDPLAFRLANLDNERMRGVLDAVARRFDWARQRANRRPGTGVGIACGTEKGSFAAACVEVEADAAKGTIKVLRIVEAFECGAILNPSNVLAQIEGSIIQGLGGALTERLEFAGGRLLNGSFAKYRVPRFRDVPPIEVVSVNRTDIAPAGAGETPIIPVAPAIAAAIFHATGVRLRAMPLGFPPARS